MSNTIDNFIQSASDADTKYSNKIPSVKEAKAITDLQSLLAKWNALPVVIDPTPLDKQIAVSVTVLDKLNMAEVSESLLMDHGYQSQADQSAESLAIIKRQDKLIDDDEKEEQELLTTLKKARADVDRLKAELSHAQAQVEYAQDDYNQHNPSYDRPLRRTHQLKTRVAKLAEGRNEAPTFDSTNVESCIAYISLYDELFTMQELPAVKQWIQANSYDRTRCGNALGELRLQEEERSKGYSMAPSDIRYRRDNASEIWRHNDAIIRENNGSH